MPYRSLSAMFFLSVSLLIASAHAQTAAVGEAAPAISAKDWINGGPYTLTSLNDKVTVIEFWATWCPPCRASIPHLNELHNKYSSKGVVIIGITNQPQDKIKDFVKEQNMRYVVACGSNSARDYGISTIPNAFVIVNGEIFWHGHPTDGLEAAIAAGLRAPKAVVKKVSPAPTPGFTPVVPPAAEPRKTADTAIEPAAGDKPTSDLIREVTYLMKDGRRIEAEKAVEAGAEWAVKDKAGVYQMLRKVDVEKVIK